MFYSIFIYTTSYVCYLVLTLSGVASPLEVIPSNSIETAKAKVYIAEDGSLTKAAFTRWKRVGRHTLPDCCSLSGILSMADKPVLPHTPTHTCGNLSYWFILASTHRDQPMVWLKLTALFTGCSSTDVCISDIDEALKRDRVEVLYTSTSMENELYSY